MPLRDIYLLLIRLLLGYVFASSGLCKLTGGQFGQLIGPPTALMAPGLAPIWPFLATMQVLVGAVVLSGRWALLGLIGLVPLNAGILAYTVGNHWTGTPFVNGLLLALNVLALLAEWPWMRGLLVPEAPPTEAPRLVRLFPGRGLPVVTLAALSGAAGVALAGLPLPLVIALGVVGFGATWAHALRGSGLPALDKVVVALPGVAVLGLSLAPLISRVFVIGAMYAGGLSGVVGVVVLAVAHWAQARRRTTIS